MSAVVGSQLNAAEGDDAGAKPKYTVKQVMTEAHKGGLLKKVLEGKASQEEKLALLDHYVSLTENKPLKGTQESWDQKTNAIVVAAAKVAVGRDDGNALLKKVTDCMACHKEHKPS
jgi:hypothetical protein